MKKILIIQRDDAYFLFETIQVLEKNLIYFKNSELFVLVNEEAKASLYNNTTPILRLLTDEKDIENITFDMSANLSVKDESAVLHGKINSLKRIGSYQQDEKLYINNLWSTYLLTLKSKAPFLTFHLQDIYKNILEIRNQNFKKTSLKSCREIYFSFSSTDFFSAKEQEIFFAKLSELSSIISIKSIFDVDLVNDHSNSLYIGPPSLEALKLCETGARAIFLSYNFKGFNLLPYNTNFRLITANEKLISADELFRIVVDEVTNNGEKKSQYSEYYCASDNTQSMFLSCTNESDAVYPFYQAYFVLWSYLLELREVNLKLLNYNEKQRQLLKTQSDVLAKLIQLHKYSLSAIDQLRKNSANSDSNSLLYQEQVAHVKEVSEKIASAFPLLRQLLDFYRIQKSIFQGATHEEQIQNSFLTHAEEHQALVALKELFSVTLDKNDINI